MERKQPKFTLWKNNYKSCHCNGTTFQLKEQDSIIILLISLLKGIQNFSLMKKIKIMLFSNLTVSKTLRNLRKSSLDTANYFSIFLMVMPEVISNNLQTWTKIIQCFFIPMHTRKQKPDVAHCIQKADMPFLQHSLFHLNGSLVMVQCFFISVISIK